MSEISSECSMLLSEEAIFGWGEPVLKFSVILLSGLMLATGVAGEVLITESEARLPAAPASAPPTRAISRGPGIRILAPDAGSPGVNSPFPLRIAFEPRGGAKIDPATVRLTYLRGNGVELTDRVKSGLTEKGIDLKSAEAPPGEHQIRIAIQDSEGRQTSAVLTVNVVN